MKKLLMAGLGLCTSGVFAAEEILAQMTIDFGSTGGIYATGDSKARLAGGGCHSGSRGMLEVYNRTEKWNSGEFNLTGKVDAGPRPHGFY